MLDRPAAVHRRSAAACPLRPPHVNLPAHRGSTLRIVDGTIVTRRWNREAWPVHSLPQRNEPPPRGGSRRGAHRGGLRVALRAVREGRHGDRRRSRARTRRRPGRVRARDRRMPRLPRRRAARGLAVARGDECGAQPASRRELRNHRLDAGGRVRGGARSGGRRRGRGAPAPGVAARAPASGAFLRYYADLSYAEIGETLGLRTGTVSATLAAAHRTLRGRLRPVAA